MSLVILDKLTPDPERDDYKKPKSGFWRLEQRQRAIVQQTFFVPPEPLPQRFLLPSGRGHRKSRKTCDRFYTKRPCLRRLEHLSCAGTTAMPSWPVNGICSDTSSNMSKITSTPRRSICRSVVHLSVGRLLWSTLCHFGTAVPAPAGSPRIAEPVLPVLRPRVAQHLASGKSESSR